MADSDTPILPEPMEPGSARPIAAETIDEILAEMPAGFPKANKELRPIHTKGIAAFGTFRGTPEALSYCKAAYFGTGWTPVTVRFSNGNGQLDPDSVKQIRGMAVRFHNGAFYDFTNEAILPPEDGEVDLADLVCMSAQMFMVKRAEDLPGFERALKPEPIVRATLLQKIRGWLRLSPVQWQPKGAKESPNQGVFDWANEHPEGQAFAMANGMVAQAALPASYLRTSFHAVHAFEVTGEDGHSRFVRFSFEPSSGVRRRNSDEPEPGDDYLQEDLRDRLESDVALHESTASPGETLSSRVAAPARFTLRMQIADPLDDPADPTTVWPSNRQQVVMGTLELHHVPEDQEKFCEKLAFNPTRVVPGIALSADPTLLARRYVYEESQERRNADLCPLHHLAPMALSLTP